MIQSRLYDKLQPMKILIAFASNAGSTAEVARTMAETLKRQGCQVDVLSFTEVKGCDPYDAVLIGAPMILGWHRGAPRFIKKWQDRLSRIPVAYFMTALELTSGNGQDFGEIEIYQDPDLISVPRKEGKLSLKEKRTTLGTYLGPVLKKSPRVRPTHVALFNGKLDYSKLKLPQMLFVMLIIRAQAGDFRDWDRIRDWTENLIKVWKEKG